MFDLFFAAWPVRTSCEKMVLFLLPVLFVHTFTGVHTKNTLSCFDLTGQNRKEREQKKNNFFAACPNRPSREKKKSKT
jgi:hypothetical protein